MTIRLGPVIGVVTGGLPGAAARDSGDRETVSATVWSGGSEWYMMEIGNEEDAAGGIRLGVIVTVGA